MDIADVNGLIIDRGEFKTDGSKLTRTFTITAVKKGNYTLTPVIKVKDKNNSNEKILAKTSYKIKAVESAQAYIKLIPQTADGITIDRTQDGIDRIIIDNDKDIKEFQVTAKVTDRNGENEDDFNSLKLVWSTTDKKAASVKAGSDTHTAKVTVKGEGHTILTAKAKDTAGHTAVLHIEIRNYAPRVDVSKVNVNLAYDYNSIDGRELALNSGGVVEIVPAYQVSYDSVEIYSDDKKSLNHDFSLYKDTNSYKYIVCAADSAKTGTYNCYLGVKPSSMGEPYFYPLKITVIDKQAKVTVKSNKAVNIFYRSEPASIDISISGVYNMISQVTWTDNSDATGNGFASTASVFSDSGIAVTAKHFYFEQENIELNSKNKLSDTGIVSGFVSVKLSGYKQANEGIKTQIKWCYKKPAIVAKDASTTLLPSIPDKSSGYFILYNKTEGSNIVYSNDSYDTSVPKYYYNEILSNNAAIKITGIGSGISYTYSGDKTNGTEKVSFTLKADDWREPLTAVHTIKFAQAVPYLSTPQLVVNTTRVGTMYTDIRLKNAYSGYLECDDIIIEGKDKKAEALLDNDMLEISKDTDINYRINVKQNRAETMNQPAIANGTYSYKVTPCYTDISGNRIEAKALILKIKVTNKEISAKTKVKGSLDLVKGVNSTSKNYIELTSTFSNIGSGYSIVSSKLTGEYSEYFRLYNYGRGNIHRLTIAQEGKLKAGYKYKLAIEYTVKMGDGDTFVVKDKTFTVKPKQSKAKITVTNNNQILYAAADSITRGYSLSVSDSSYIITGVEGSLDCNKDGKADIQVKYSGNSTGSVIANVSITDADGVLTNTGMKGKTYSIPITVKLKGRDGISKDIQTKIKVTVRR